MRIMLGLVIVAIAASSSARAEPLSQVEQKVFVQSCSSNEAAMKPYCECTLAELQKRMSPEEIRALGASDQDPMKNENFANSVIACVHLIKSDGSSKEGDTPKGGETLTKLEQKVFVQSCTSDKDAMRPYCECSLAELQKRMTVAEIRGLGALSETELMNNDKFSDAVVACADKLP